MMKGSGGAVGLTENPPDFRKRMLAGPEQDRLLKEFDYCFSDEMTRVYQPIFQTRSLESD